MYRLAVPYRRYNRTHPHEITKTSSTPTKVQPPEQKSTLRPPDKSTITQEEMESQTMRNHGIRSTEICLIEDKEENVRGVVAVSVTLYPPHVGWCTVRLYTTLVIFQPANMNILSQGLTGLVST
jgi:hypothetical protein